MGKTYTWESEALSKYGQVETEKLIRQQQARESDQRGNACEHCGESNQGTLIELDDGRPIIVHFGSYTKDGKCCHCGKNHSKAKAKVVAV